MRTFIVISQADEDYQGNCRIEQYIIQADHKPTHEEICKFLRNHKDEPTQRWKELGEEPYYSIFEREIYIL